MPITADDVKIQDEPVGAWDTFVEAPLLGPRDADFSAARHNLAISGFSLKESRFEFFTGESPKRRVKGVYGGKKYAGPLCDTFLESSERLCQMIANGTASEIIDKAPEPKTRGQEVAERTIGSAYKTLAIFNECLSCGDKDSVGIRSHLREMLAELIDDEIREATVKQIVKDVAIARNMARADKLHDAAKHACEALAEQIEKPLYCAPA